MGCTKSKPDVAQQPRPASAQDPGRRECKAPRSSLLESLAGHQCKLVDLQDGVGCACLKGLKSAKTPNQDSFCALQLDGRCAIYGVFDGHGQEGHAISQYVRDHLPMLLVMQEALEDDPRTALQQAFEQMQELIIEADEKGIIKAGSSGSTASLIYHDYRSNMLHVGNVGDSRCVSGQWDTTLQAWDAMELSTDHKLTLPQERDRIQRAGGVVVTDAGGWSYRVYAPGQRGPGLNMSRSLGDLFGFHSCGISPFPDVKSHELQDLGFQKRSGSAWCKCQSNSTTSTAAGSSRSSTDAGVDLDDISIEDISLSFTAVPPVVEQPRMTSSDRVDDIRVSDRFLILCSDGVWDYLTSVDAVRVIGQFAPEEATAAAEHLAHIAKERWSYQTQGEKMDDITVIVVRLDNGQTASIPSPCKESRRTTSRSQKHVTFEEQPGVARATVVNDKHLLSI